MPASINNNISDPPRAIAAMPALPKVSLWISGIAISTEIPAMSKNMTKHTRPTTMENKNKLFPSVLYSAHGSLIAPRFFTMPSKSMNLPRLEIQAMSKPSIRNNKIPPATMEIKSPMLFSIHSLPSSKPDGLLLLLYQKLPPFPPCSPHCARNAQKPSANHFLNANGLNKIRTMWFHAGVIGLIAEMFIYIS